MEFGCKIAKQSISILIDPGSSHSYVTPKVVESCSLRKMKHDKSWLVQLATGKKRRASEVVMECPIELNGLLAVTLYLYQLTSDIFLGRGVVFFLQG